MSTSDSLELVFFLWWLRGFRDECAAWNEQGPHLVTWTSCRSHKTFSSSKNLTGPMWRLMCAVFYQFQSLCVFYAYLCVYTCACYPEGGNKHMYKHGLYDLSLAWRAILFLLVWFLCIWLWFPDGSINKCGKNCLETSLISCYTTNQWCSEVLHN